MLVYPEFLLTVIKYPDRLQPCGVSSTGVEGMLVGQMAVLCISNRLATSSYGYRCWFGQRMTGCPALVAGQKHSVDELAFSNVEDLHGKHG